MLIELTSPLQSERTSSIKSSGFAMITYRFAPFNLPSRKAIFSYIHEDCLTKRSEIQNAVPCYCDFEAVFSGSITIINGVALVGVVNPSEETISLCWDRSMSPPLILVANFESYKDYADNISVITVASSRRLLTKALIFAPCLSLSFVICLIILKRAPPRATAISYVLRFLSFRVSTM